MSSQDGMFTDGTPALQPRVNSIPLTDVDVHAPGEASIGTLIKDATANVSTLVRGEIELAKTEITDQVKKGAMGGGFFAVAGVIAGFSLFFLFFTMAEVLDLWLPRWAAFLIVFIFMLVLAGIAALIGLQKVKKVGAPQRTIDSVNELKTVVPQGDGARYADRRAGRNDGMFT